MIKCLETNAETVLFLKPIGIVPIDKTFPLPDGYFFPLE